MRWCMGMTVAAIWNDALTPCSFLGELIVSTELYPLNRSRGAYFVFVFVPSFDVCMYVVCCVPLGSGRAGPQPARGTANSASRGTGEEAWEAWAAWAAWEA